MYARKDLEKWQFFSPFRLCALKERDHSTLLFSHSAIKKSKVRNQLINFQGFYKIDERQAEHALYHKEGTGNTDDMYWVLLEVKE